PLRVPVRRHQRLPLHHGRDLRDRGHVHAGEPGGRSALRLARSPDPLLLTAVATASATSAAPLARPAAPAAAPTLLAPERRDVWRYLLRNPTAILGALIVLVWIAASVLAPRLAPYDPIEINVDIRLEPPSSAHWLGVDGFG